MKTKKALTLLEIIIVIFLITLITGAIGYNMRGTLDRGRAFRTEQAKEELHDLLLVCAAEGNSLKKVVDNPGKYIENLKLAKDPKKILEDGWGNPFKITLSEEGDDFVIESDALAKYNKKTGRKA